MFPTCKNSQKWVKNQISTDKHSSFDVLIQDNIQEDIDLSDIYLAVCTNLLALSESLMLTDSLSKLTAKAIHSS